MPSPPIRNSPQTPGALPRPVEILVVTSPLRPVDSWPEPLPRLLAHNALRLQCVPDLFAAAALLKQRHFAALLVDPETLSRGELKMMATFKRHVVLPLWSLPTRNRQALISELGLLAWDEAARSLLQFLLPRYTPHPLEGNTTKSPSPTPGSASDSPPGPQTHNLPPAAPEEHTEIPVASKLADRYDKSTTLPLLTEAELRALLGPADPGAT